MSGEDTLSRHDPAPPPELATAIRAAVDGKSDPAAGDFLEAAERLLDKVLRSDCETRASALDLLTVDALMTHSLLLASKDPQSREDFAERAMTRVASHATNERYPVPGNRYQDPYPDRYPGTRSSAPTEPGTMPVPVAVNRR